MDDRSEKRTRRPRIVNLIRLIEEGEYDDVIKRLSDAIEDRKKFLREKLLKQLRELGYEEPKRVVHDLTGRTSKKSDNPFVARAQEKATEETNYVSAPEDIELVRQPTTGDLSALELGGGWESRSPFIGGLESPPQ